MESPLDVPIALADQRRITVDEFQRMCETDFFGEDERVELLEGVLVKRAPMGPAHAWSVQELNQILTRAVPEGYRVRPQLPVVIGRYSAPFPDLAVVKLDEGARRIAHPETALLVVEVSDSSFSYDRNVKVRIYARANIPEYWVVDVKARAVEIYLDPDPVAARYGSVTRVPAEGELRALRAPIPAIRVVDILP